MVGRLDGRVLLITGAGSGIGRAAALLASTEGASIGAVDIDEAGLDSTVEAVRRGGGRIAACAVDVADGGALTDSVDSLALQLGRLADRCS